MSYIVRKQNKRGQRMGYVKAIFITYRAAQKMADWLDAQHPGVVHIVDLHHHCDCSDDFIIHA